MSSNKSTIILEKQIKHENEENDDLGQCQYASIHVIKS